MKKTIVTIKNTNKELGIMFIEAIEFLMDFQWDFGYCQHCHAHQQSGHYDDCRLGAFLARATNTKKGN